MAKDNRFNSPKNSKKNKKRLFNLDCTPPANVERLETHKNVDNSPNFKNMLKKNEFQNMSTSTADTPRFVLTVPYQNKQSEKKSDSLDNIHSLSMTCVDKHKKEKNNKHKYFSENKSSIENSATNKCEFSIDFDEQRYSHELSEADLTLQRKLNKKKNKHTLRNTSGTKNFPIPTANDLHEFAYSQSEDNVEHQSKQKKKRKIELDVHASNTINKSFNRPPEFSEDSFVIGKKLKKNEPKKIKHSDCFSNVHNDSSMNDYSSNEKKKCKKLHESLMQNDSLCEIKGRKRSRETKESELNTFETNIVCNTVSEIPTHNEHTQKKLVQKANSSKEISNISEDNDFSFQKKLQKKEKLNKKSLKGNVFQKCSSSATKDLTFQNVQENFTVNSDIETVSNPQKEKLNLNHIVDNFLDGFNMSKDQVIDSKKKLKKKKRKNRNKDLNSNSLCLSGFQADGDIIQNSADKNSNIKDHFEEVILDSQETTKVPNIDNLEEHIKVTGKDFIVDAHIENSDKNEKFNPTELNTVKKDDCISENRGVNKTRDKNLSKKSYLINNDSYLLGKSKNLESLDFSEDPISFHIPLLHAPEIINKLTAEDVAQFKENGVEIKLGKWTMEEDTILKKNHEDFIKRTGVSDPKILFGIGMRSRSHDQMRFLKAKHFYARLGRYLNNRTLYQIYRHARILFDPRRKYDDKVTEDGILTVLNSSAVYGCKWEQIAENANMSANKCTSIYDWHSKTVNKGKWSEEEIEHLTEAMKKVARSSDISSDEIKDISWDKVSALVKTRNISQCRLYWAENLAWSKNSRREKWLKIHYTKLIELLRAEYFVDEEALVDWKELQNHFAHVSPSYMYIYKKWRYLKSKVHNFKKKIHKDILDELNSKYIGYRKFLK